MSSTRVLGLYLFGLQLGGNEMRRKLSLISLGLVLLFGGAANSKAEVKRVQMHIAGYLCGN